MNNDNYLLTMKKLEEKQEKIRKEQIKADLIKYFAIGLATSMVVQLVKLARD